MTTHPSTVERRKTVCRALANVLQKTPLAEEFDPKAFYMLLSTNFAVLDRDEGFDLGPLWTTLGGPGDLRQAGLFLAFDDRLRQLNLTSILPPEVAEMDEETRQRAVSQAFSREAGDAEVDTLASDEYLFDTGEMPELSPDELRPLISDELKREIISAVVRGIKRSAVGVRIDGGQLAYRIDESFDELCDGKSIDVGPILDSLRDFQPDVGDLYVALVRIHRRLTELRIDLRAPDLGVDAETGARLVEAADTEEKAALRMATAAAPATRTSAPAEAPPPPPPTERTETHRDLQLRRYGLKGMSAARWRLVRWVVMTTLLVTALGAAWALRPNRILDFKSYPMPLRTAKLKSGLFVAQLDDARWYRMPFGDRSVAVRRMEARLRDEGRLIDATILDARKRVVIRALGSELRASRQAMESPDGVTPPKPGPYREPSDMARELESAENRP